jgi:hypothetical protein
MSSYFEKLEPFELALAGKTYSVSFTASLASAATTHVQIKTGSTSCIIMDWHVSGAGQPLTVEAIENPTVTDGTSPVVAYRTNRQLSGAASTTFFSNPTSISGGTVIFTESIPSEKGTGGSLDSGHVWVLKKNEDYLWKITNTGNNTTTVSGVIFFAETIIP